MSKKISTKKQTLQEKIDDKYKQMTDLHILIPDQTKRICGTWHLVREHMGIPEKDKARWKKYNALQKQADVLESKQTFLEIQRIMRGD